MPFYVIWVMYLAFLAPDIVRAIHVGSHPPSLTADKRVRLVHLPIGWDEQQRLLGFAPLTT